MSGGPEDPNVPNGPKELNEPNGVEEQNGLGGPDDPNGHAGPNYPNEQRARRLRWTRMEVERTKWIMNFELDPNIRTGFKS